MRYAIDVAPLGELADPRAIVRLAVAAEAAGWDGLSTWDILGVAMGVEAADPFVALAAVAAATERLRLITSVIVLPRRRPQLVAQAAGTLDRLSGGRLVLGIGAGADPGDFVAFGDPFEAPQRIRRMDEAAEIVDELLRGRRLAHTVGDYVVDGVAVGPRPVQEPRPPIWLGGMRPGAIRRAARWDGWIAVAVSEDGSTMELTPDAFGEAVGRLHLERAALGRADEPLEVALFAFSEPGEADLVAEYAAAGATWWLESLSPLRGSLQQLLARVEAGPPRRP
jgi:alkanesulfonate monooxygenase SsuD/methylene tetrahydromethanopterin reductase-like flavin-dependent oxidoreductase (luciferase family)